MSIPTFMSGQEVVLTKTANGGFALSQNKDDAVETCVVFETWDACVYYLGANFAVPTA